MISARICVYESQLETVICIQTYSHLFMDMNLFTDVNIYMHQQIVFDIEHVLYVSLLNLLALYNLPANWFGLSFMVPGYIVPCWSYQCTKSYFIQLPIQRIDVTKKFVY